MDKVEKVARAIAVDQAKRLYGIDRGPDEAWQANTNYGREQLLADSRAAIEAYEGAMGEAAAFLCERLRELERDLLDDEVGRQFNGHVAPALARLEAITSKGE